MDTDTVVMDFSDGATACFDEEEPEQKFQHKIRMPIVYTTKLDEMIIFKDDTTDMGVNTFINSIIKESKPKLNWKRKCTHAIHSYYSYEDLSCYINTFNRKVARIAKNNNNLLSLCKPVKVVLEDIKYTLLRTQSTESRNSKIEEKICPIISDNTDNPLSTYIQSRKLQSRILYDLQLKEADMYFLDKSYFIKEYTKFRIDKSNSKIYRSLKMDKNVFHVSCCCWYNREKSLAMLPVTPHETLRFMRKPHKCAINLCRCCCRNKTITSPVKTSSLKPLEPLSIWLNRMTEVNASLPLSDKSKQTLLSKSMSVVPKLKKYINPVNPVIEIQDTLPFLHSTNIDFGGEYYAIGGDGQIKFYLKNTGKDRRKCSNLRLKTANNIVGDICCWYKREEFSGRLLALGALPNTVNYIRSAHPCSLKTCSCCCKPSNTEKPKLTLIRKSARHTNDLVTKKVNIKVRFSGDAEKPVNPINTNNNLVSFNVSLSALEMISKGRTEPYVIDSIIPESSILDKKNSCVRVLVEKTPKHKTVIECTHHHHDRLKNFTTKELKMLDAIFCAVNKTIGQPKDEKKTRNYRVWKNYSSCNYHTIYPLLLNAQLSVATDLRSKRFLPSLRAHLDKYILPLPQMKNISVWLDAERSLESASTMLVESKANANEKKIKRTGKPIKEKGKRGK